MTDQPKDDPTPNDVAAENVAYFLKRRGISRRELAQRMHTIGLSAWKHEKTVRRVLDRDTDGKGQRKKITTDELVALAAVLETTVETLLTPGVEHYIDENTGELHAYKRLTRVGSIRMSRIPFLELVSSRGRGSRPTPSEVGSLPMKKFRWDEWDRDGERPPPFALSDVRADYLATMRATVRSLYSMQGVPVPDDIAGAGEEELSEYIDALVENHK